MFVLLHGGSQTPPIAATTDPFIMKDRFIHAYAVRFTFMVTAGIVAVVIIQFQALLGLPSKLRRALS